MLGCSVKDVSLYCRLLQLYIWHVWHFNQDFTTSLQIPRMKASLFISQQCSESNSISLQESCPQLCIDSVSNFYHSLDIKISAAAAVASPIHSATRLPWLPLELVWGWHFEEQRSKGPNFIVITNTFAVQPAHLEHVLKVCLVTVWVIGALRIQDTNTFLFANSVTKVILSINLGSWNMINHEL